ncbi:AAA family ATPase [Planomicrobium okeanokoites]|uniref:AAA family ATPase n=1 Tax=Planomicrobium okeanokoites TaxID=244 RepID=UPI002491CC0C|nr:AAA family ATPase [Planomicrobium okeanokoites]
MELLYFYLEKSDFFNDMSADLGSDLTFQIINNELIITENKNYIPNFFGSSLKENQKTQITNFNCIVGENGTGKSTLLKSFINIINNNYTMPFLVVFKEKGKYYYFSKKTTTIIYNKVLLKDTKNIVYKNIEIHFKKPNPSSFSTVFFSNVFDLNTNFIELEEVTNISTMNLVKERPIEYFTEEMKKQILFSAKYEEDLNLKSIIKIPDLLSISFYLGTDTFDLTNFSLNIDEELEEIFDYAFERKSVFERKVGEELYKEMLRELYKDINDISSKYSVFLSQELREALYHTRDPRDITNFFKALIGKLKVFQNKKYVEIFKNKYEKKYNDLIVNTEKLYNAISVLTKKFSIGKDKPISVSKKSSVFKQFFELYLFSEIDYRFIEFKWENLSSGEAAFLSLFGRFESINKGIARNVIIFIDEGELYFHPKWQQDWVKLFVDTITYIYKEKKIQILMTTHSPFILSDLPSSNVILLKKEISIENHSVSKIKNLENHPLTFGSNIQELFSNSFFLKSGLTGTFARNKINNIVNQLIDPNEEIQSDEDLRKVIEMIAEPVVRRKLIDLYNEKVNLNLLSIDKKIQYLQEEINQLKKAHNG